MACGFSLMFIIPSYLYGLRLNRIVENNYNHIMYHWQFADKRNRLTHNLIMEHFEMHKEKFEEVSNELNEYGPMIFYNLENVKKTHGVITQDDLALIDEISGLTDFLNNFMMNQKLPETTREKIRGYMTEYKGEKPKEIALNEMAIAMFGDMR